MKKRVCILLVVFITAGMLASCGHADAPAAVTKEESSVTDNVTNEITTAEETTTDESTTETPTEAEATTLEAAPEEWKDWQKNALAVMQSVEVKYYGSELTGITFTLQDLSQDGIPEIIEELSYIEWYDGPEAIWTWNNGNYVQAYSAGNDHQIKSIAAYRNKQTGKIELWDLGNIDFELKDYYPESPDSGGISEVFGPYDPINNHIRRLEFIDGKLQIVESHDELKNFATYGMPDEQVKRAWEALHDFSTVFWDTHDREPKTIYSKSLEFLDFKWQFDMDTDDVSVLVSEKDLPPDKRYYGKDYYSNLESDSETESYTYNRNHLRIIVEEYAQGTQETSGQ